MAIQAAMSGFDEDWFKALSENPEKAKAEHALYEARKRMDEAAAKAR
jgi:hypothetical protein